MIPNIEVTVGHHTVRGLVVVTSAGWIILKNHLAKLVEDPQDKTVLHENGERLRQTVRP